MNREELLEHFGPSNPQKFGSGGWLYLVDTMGNDQAICQAARISYGSGTKAVTEDRELIRYLVRNHHTSPLEQCELKVHIRLPIDIWRQMVRHRTANVNEYSTRYSIAIDSQAVATTWRTQAIDNKQGSAGTLVTWPDLEKASAFLHSQNIDVTDIKQEWNEAIVADVSIGDFLSARESELQAWSRRVYLERLALGVAREQARKDLPMSTYTEVYYKQDLHNLLHFLWLRTDPHAQQEIQEIANCIGNIVEAWCPVAYQAWIDYKRDNIQLSSPEQEAFNMFVTPGAHYELNNKLDSWSTNPNTRAETLVQAGLTSKTERIAFIKKLEQLLGL